MTTTDMTADMTAAARYRKLPVDALIVDGRYQRELNVSRVRAIVRAFNANQLGVLEVSTRPDDEYAVFDGQHRLVALRELGKNDAPCLIHSGLTAQDEASLFARLHLSRRGLSALERFRAQVFAGVEQAVTIAGIVESQRFEIAGYSPTNRAIRAVGALERIYRRDGAIALRETLQTVRLLWDGDPRSTDGYLLEGLSQFLVGYGNRLGDEHFDKLAAAGPTVILRRALGQLQGGGGHARHAIDSELRKVAGVRGRPRAR